MKNKKINKKWYYSMVFSGLVLLMALDFLLKFDWQLRVIYILVFFLNVISTNLNLHSKK